MLTNRQARRLCVQGQRLSSPRPASIVDAVRDLSMVQIDPTQWWLAPSIWCCSRGWARRFQVADLERLLWTDRALFEYWVHIVPTSTYWIHRESMRRYPSGGGYAGAARRMYIHEWLRANHAFRRYVLRELRQRGPLRARDLEDRAAVPWRSGGWNDDIGRSVSMMLDLMWFKGEVMIVGRDGQQRLWDIAERSLPMDEPRRSQREVARSIVERQLRARGVGTTKQFGWAFDGRPPGWERALTRARP